LLKGLSLPSILPKIILNTGGILSILSFVQLSLYANCLSILFHFKLRVMDKVILITPALTEESSTLWENVNTFLLKIAAKANCLQCIQRINGVVGVVPRVLPL